MTSKNNRKLTFNIFKKILFDLQEEYSAEVDNCRTQEQREYYQSKIEALSELLNKVYDYVLEENNDK